MTDTLIVLAAGLSSRMKRSESQPGISDKALHDANRKSKALIGVGENSRPLLDLILLNAFKAGIKNIILVVGSQRNDFYEYYGNESKINLWSRLSISYASQTIPKSRVKPLGTADAVFQALEQYPHLKASSFLVCNADNLYSAEAFLSLIKAPNEQALLAYDRDALHHSMERISSFALCKMNKDGFLIDIIEKPSAEKFDNYRDSAGKLRVSMNLWKLSGNSFDFLKNCPLDPIRNEKELPRAVLNMIQANSGRVFCIPISEHVPDLTTKSDISAINSYLKKK